MINYSSRSIIFNKKVCYEYFIEDKFEAGIVLEGWEVKSLRAMKVNIDHCYVILKNGESFLLGAHFLPLTKTSFYKNYNSTRTRKLLLKQYELNSLYGFTNRKGYSIVVISIYLKKFWYKVQIGIARGKKQYDKRLSLKKREWHRNKERLLKYKKI